MSSKARIAITCAVMICAAIVLWMANSGRPTPPTLTYSQFLEQVRTGCVASVIVTGGNSGSTPATCRLKDGDTVRTVLPSDYRDALAAMQDHLVNVEIRDSSSGSIRLFLNATPFLLLFGAWLFLMFRRSGFGGAI